LIYSSGYNMQMTRRIMDGAMVLFLTSCFFSIAVNSLSLGLMAICWALLMVMERRWSAVSTPYDWFFLAWIVAEYLATAFSENVAQSLLFSKRLLLIGVVYFFATHITSREKATLVILSLLGSAALFALIGVGKLLLAGPGGIVRLGIIQFYMTTSELLMIAMLLTLPFAVHPGTPLRWRIAAGLAMLPMSISLYATVTRGAYLAAAAGIVCIALARNVKLIIPLVLNSDLRASSTSSILKTQPASCSGRRALPFSHIIRSWAWEILTFVRCMIAMPRWKIRNTMDIFTMFHCNFS
jgi:hypothetical protein